MHHSPYGLSIPDAIGLVKQIDEPMGLVNLRKSRILEVTFFIFETQELFAVKSIPIVPVFRLKKPSPHEEYFIDTGHLDRYKY